MTPAPKIVGPWDVEITTVFDDASVVSSTRLLRDMARPLSMYEIHSIRATMSEAGTGNLSAMGITDGQVPVGVTNTDIGMMSLHTGSQGIAVTTPTIFWHWGRSAQRALTDPMIYLPRRFYWDGQMHGVWQNGAGAGIEYMWVIQFRVVTFGEADYLALANKVPPATSRKRRFIST